MARDSKRDRFGGSQQGDPAADVAGDGTPVDIGAVRRDDALIDAIASDGPVATDSADEYQIATLLANWRAEVIAPPMPAGPDLDDIVAAVNQEIGARQARVSAGSRLRLVRPIAGAAAAIALVVGGMTAFSYNAQPGDPLWKVKQVVFSEQAASTVANNDSTSDLQQAQQLISAGNVSDAKAHLARASQRAADVDDPSTRNQLMTWLNRLQTEVDQRLPQSVPSLPNITTTPTAPSTPRQIPATPASGRTGTTWGGNPPSGQIAPGQIAPGQTTVDGRSAQVPPIFSSPDRQIPSGPVDTSLPGPSRMLVPPASSQVPPTQQDQTQQQQTQQQQPASARENPETDLPLTKTSSIPSAHGFERGH